MKRYIFILISVVVISITSVMADTAKNVIVVTKNKSTFSIAMTANATTGYAWFLTDYNPRLIRPISHAYKVDAASVKQRITGAPGKSIWTFKVLPAAFKVPMATHLKWVYIRPWEGMSLHQMDAQYTIVISK